MCRCVSKTCFRLSFPRGFLWRQTPWASPLYSIVLRQSRLRCRVCLWRWYAHHQHLWTVSSEGGSRARALSDRFRAYRDWDNIRVTGHGAGTVQESGMHRAERQQQSPACSYATLIQPCSHGKHPGLMWKGLFCSKQGR